MTNTASKVTQRKKKVKALAPKSEEQGKTLKKTKSVKPHKSEKS